MKTKFRFFQWLMILMLSMSALGAWAQTSQTPTQTVCIGSEPYRVDPIPGATFAWSISGGVPANYQINGTGDNITVDWKTPGTYVLSVYSYLVISCPSTTQSVTVTVNPTNTAGTPSSAPTLCTNTALTNITIATTGATGIGTPTGLPAGVTATWSANVITISGTPTASGAFNYTIPLTGGCGTVNATGSITVNQLPTTSPIYHN